MTQIGTRVGAIRRADGAYLGMGVFAGHAIHFDDSSSIDVADCWWGSPATISAHLARLQQKDPFAAAIEAGSNAR